MKKLILILGLLFPMTLLAQQPVSVTGTVTGANGATYNNGTYQVQLVDANGSPLQSFQVGGAALSQVQFSGALSGVGTLSMNLYANTVIYPNGTQWRFNICSIAPSSVPSSPQLIAPRKCYSQAVTISGAGDISGALSASAPGLTAIDPTTGTLALSGPGCAPGSYVKGDNTGCGPGGGAANPAGPAFAVQLANSGVTGFQGDPNITINPSTHTFTAPNFILSSLTPGTSPVCPNGSGGALTTVGCSGGGGGAPASPSFAVQLANSGVTGFAADPNITINTTTHQLTLGSDLPTGSQAASANAAVVVNSVLAYGAKADAKTSNTAVMTTGNTTVTCAGCGFVAADQGKWMKFYGGAAALFADIAFTAKSGWSPNNVAQIASVTDATHVVLSKTPISGYSSASMEYGTDDVLGFNACATANAQLGGTCQIPSGNYLLATAPYYAVLGASDNGGYGTPAGGTGAVITATLGSGATAGQIVSYTVSNGGSGYTPSSTLILSYSGGCLVGNVGYDFSCGSAYGTATVNSSGVITAATSVFGGFGFTSAPTVTVQPVGGDGASATATVSGGAINSTTIVTPGAGYASNFPVYGIGGTGCTVISTNVTGMPLTAIGTAVVTAGGVTSVTYSNAGTGCTAPPTLIFGSYACGSSLNAQCTNLAPLAPFIIPIQILTVPFVSWQGPTSQGSTIGQSSHLYGTWDGTQVNNNQPMMFGGLLYLGSMSISNLYIQESFIGIGTPFSATSINIYGNYFNANAIGVFAGATDFGFQLNNNTFANTRAPYLVGGTWNTRVDAITVAGGFFNSQKMDGNDMLLWPLHDSKSIAIDDWFANNFWHPEFSAASTDFLEPCTFPQTPNQRQTSGNFILSSGSGGNGMCYPGATGSVMLELTRNQGGSNSHNISNTQGKYCFRYLYYGNITQGIWDGGGGCEQGTSLVSDPYRTSAQQHAAIVFPGGPYASAQTAIKNLLWIESGTVTQPLWQLGVSNGVPSARWSNISCGSCSATPAVLLGDNYPIPLTTVGQTVNGTIAINTYNALALNSFPINTGPEFVMSCTTVGSAACTQTQPTWNTNGVYIGGQNNPIFVSADIFDWYNTSATQIISIASDGGITNTGANTFNSVKVTSGGTAMTGNQGTGAKVQHSTGSPTSGNCAQFDATGNVIDAGITCTAGTAINITTTTPVTASGTNAEYYNQDLTAAAAITYNLPTPAAGLRFCFKNSRNATPAATTGTIKIAPAVPASQTIIYNGSASSSTGFFISSGAAGDYACVRGISATQWEAFVGVGVWTLN